MEDSSAFRLRSLVFSCHPRPLVLCHCRVLPTPAPQLHHDRSRPAHTTQRRHAMKKATHRVADLGAVAASIFEPPSRHDTAVRSWLHWRLESRFYLASCCFRRGLPPNYHRRCCVSHPSSRWIGVGPQRYGHQDSLDPQVSPENCIGWIVPALTETTRLKRKL